jgi:hypothetical protein
MQKFGVVCALLFAFFAAIAAVSPANAANGANALQCAQFGYNEQGTLTVTNICNGEINVAFCGKTGEALCKARPSTRSPTGKTFDYGLDTVPPHKTMWLIGVKRSDAYNGCVL